MPLYNNFRLQNSKNIRFPKLANALDAIRQIHTAFLENPMVQFVFFLISEVLFLTMILLAISSCLASLYGLSIQCSNIFTAVEHLFS